MRADPVGQALRPSGLGIGVIRRPEHGDEQLRRSRLAAQSRRSPRASCRRNRRTCARRRCGSGAWSATAAPPRRDRARRSGYSRSRRGGRRDAPPTAAAASPPAGAARGVPWPSPAAVDFLGRRPLAADRADPPASRRQAFRQRPGQAGAPRTQNAVPAAVALTPRLTAIWRLDMPAADSLSTSRILRMGNLGPGICPAPYGKERSHANSPITQRRPSPRPQAGRNRPEWVVAINRNDWSQSIVTAGPDHPVRAGATASGAQFAV